MGTVKAKVDLLRIMEAIMKEILRAIKLMVLEFTLTPPKDSNMRGSGKETCQMELARQFIQMDPDMWELSSIPKSKEMVLFLQAHRVKQSRKFTKATFLTMNSVERPHLWVQMDRLMKENGRAIKNTVMESILGQMDPSMKDGTIKEKEKGKVK